MVLQVFCVEVFARLDIQTGMVCSQASHFANRASHCPTRMHCLLFYTLYNQPYEALADLKDHRPSKRKIIEASTFDMMGEMKCRNG